MRSRDRCRVFPCKQWHTQTSLFLHFVWCRVSLRGICGLFRGCRRCQVAVSTKSEKAFTIPFAGDDVRCTGYGLLGTWVELLGRLAKARRFGLLARTWLGRCRQRERRAKSVAEKSPRFLKLHVEPHADSRRPAPVDYPGWEALARSFERLTGYALRYAREDDAPGSAGSSFPIGAGPAASAGQLVLETTGDAKRPPRKRPRISDAKEFAASVRDLLAELEGTRTALWQREAELAAGVPVIPRADETDHLAERLDAILKGGAEAVECQAAALYLLDETTSHLKLRAAWGLPKSRLLGPARPLRGAVADLEALVGHAVALEDTHSLGAGLREPP